MNPSDEMMHIVICSNCEGYEYYGEMRWLNGKTMCRQCYKHTHKEYQWTDLDGPRPTMIDFMQQEDRICRECNSTSCEGCEHQH